MLILECEAVYIVWFICQNHSWTGLYEATSEHLCKFFVEEQLLLYIYKLTTFVSYLLDLIKVYSSVVTRQRKYNSPDKHFIITEDTSCRMDYWAQAVVTTHEHHKERIVVDYSQNMNHLTILDAHSLSRINKLINTWYNINSLVQLTKEICLLSNPNWRRQTLNCFWS